MNRKFSPKVKKIIQVSREEAVRLGHEYIGTEHLLLGILSDSESLAVKVLTSLDVDLEELKFKIEEIVPSRRKDDTGYNVGSIPLNKHAEKVLKVTFLEAKVFKNEEIKPEHLMLSILKHNENTGASVLEEFEIDYDSYRLELEYVKQEMETSFDIFNQAPSDSDVPMEEEGSEYS